MTVGKQNDRPDGPELGEILTPFVLKKFESSDTHVTISGYPGEKTTHNGLMKMICLHLTYRLRKSITIL